MSTFPAIKKFQMSYPWTRFRKEALTSLRTVSLLRGFVLMGMTPIEIRYRGYFLISKGFRKDAIDLYTNLMKTNEAEGLYCLAMLYLKSGNHHPPKQTEDELVKRENEYDLGWALLIKAKNMNHPEATYEYALTYKLSDPNLPYITGCNKASMLGCRYAAAEIREYYFGDDERRKKSIKKLQKSLFDGNDNAVNTMIHFGLKYKMIITTIKNCLECMPNRKIKLDILKEMQHYDNIPKHVADYFAKQVNHERFIVVDKEELDPPDPSQPVKKNTNEVKKVTNIKRKVPKMILLCSGPPDDPVFSGTSNPSDVPGKKKKKD